MKHHGLFVGEAPPGKFSHRTQDGIGKEGIRAICQKLQAVGVLMSEATPDWSWSWEVAHKGEYTGGLPKRIQKYAHNVHGVKLDAAVTSEIGTLASAHRDAGIEYWFDFDATLSWKSGDFGDKGSCYFDSKAADNAKKKAALLECKVVGMRFYKDDTYMEGVGRILLCPMQTYVVPFNGYCPPPKGYGYYEPEISLRLSRVLAGWLSAPYKNIGIKRKDYNTMLYPSGTTALAIGPPKVIAGVTEHVFYK